MQSLEQAVHSLPSPFFVTHSPLLLCRLLMVRTHSFSTVFVQATHGQNTFVLHCLCAGYSWSEHSHSPLSLLRLLIVGTVISALLRLLMVRYIHSPLSLFRILIVGYIHSPLSLFRILIVGTLFRLILVVKTQSFSIVFV